MARAADSGDAVILQAARGECVMSALALVARCLHGSRVLSDLGNGIRRVGMALLAKAA